VDAERSPNSVAELTVVKHVVFGKDLNAVRQAGALYRHTQPQGEVVDVDPALFSQQRRRKKNPKVSTPFAHLQGRLDLVLAQVVLQFEEVVHGVLVIGVNGDPFASLSRWVNGVEPNRDCPFQVPADCLFGEDNRPLFPSRPEVVVPTSIGMRAHGLQRVCPPVYKQMHVVLDYLRTCSQAQIHRPHLRSRRSPHMCCAVDNFEMNFCQTALVNR
jgi:hypothetical protein